MKNLGHLDINVVTHCNSRCTSCSHASPFTKAYYMSPETMARDLESIKPFLSFHRIQLVGGEPTLHPNISELLGVARRSGVGSSTSIITNGRLLPKMGDDFWNALEILQLSVYGNLDRSVIDLARKKATEHKFTFCFAEFTQFYLQFKSSPDDGESFNSCPWKTTCYTLHEGKFYLCPQSAFFPSLFQELPFGIDGLPLEGLTEEKLSEFMSRDKPFNACKICLGSLAHIIPWSESKTKEEWIKGSTL